MLKIPTFIKTTFQCHHDQVLERDNPITYFTNTLYEIAKLCIPKTSCKKKRSKPWFTEDCKKAIRKRRAVLKQFNCRPPRENLEQFKIYRAKARRTIKLAKRTSWQSFVSKLSSRTSSKKVWEMIRKINGKSKPSAISHLKLNGKNITKNEDIANVIADKISMNSSSENYDRRFQQTKEKSEKNKLNFNTNSNGLEDYNLPFVIDDLLESLDKCHETASGPDDIPYRILKELPTEPLHVLLQLYNNIWEDGILPPSWKEATIIPIPKPGKDNTDPNNYRPIALTSCICKTMERMINARLVGYLESNGLITEYQSGFRSERSTTDHLIRLESFIRDAFIKKEHVIAIFFDLEKAYDTTWKYGIMKDLYDMGLRGSLPLFISDFLSDRQFRVRVGSTLSNLHEQEMGVPQGSILSVTLFNVKINSIIKCVSNNMNCSLYVDDFLLCYRSKTMNNAERNLQMSLNKVNNWALENGFRFSKTKTQCVHFCRQRSCYREPDLTIGGVKIPTADEVKFLGIIFDRKLTFIPHIKYLKAKCLKALNILKVVASTDWGADRTVQIVQIVRSKLDYGCVVYGSTSPRYIKMLDTIHH